MTQVPPTTPTPMLEDLILYPKRVQDASLAAQSVSIGRWKIDTHARRGSFLLGTAEDHVIEIDLDFPTLRRALYDIRDDAEDNFETAWPAMTEVQDWMEKSLPELARLMSDIADDPANADQPIEQLLPQLADARVTLDRAVATLDDVARFQAELPTRVAAMHGPLADESRKALERLLAVLDKAGCGHADALRQFTHYQTELALSLASLTTTAGTLRLHTAAARHAVSDLLVALRHLETEVTRVRNADASTADNATTGPPAVTADASGLSATARAWGRLAERAESLQKDALRSPLRPPQVRARLTALRT